LYNVDKQKQEWRVVLVMEGIFDAMMIDGVATLHEEISSGQLHQLYQMNKQVIYIPDQDRTGIQNVEKILEYGFNISLPKWNDNVKDVSDAVKEYGKLPTLLSILQTSTMNKIKIKTDLQRIERKIKRNEATK
jgi:DNA primase